MKKLLVLSIALMSILPAYAQQWGVVNVSVCNLKSTPEYSAEMVSQGLLGMPVEIPRIGGEYNWPEVVTPDGYHGWVHKDAITVLDREAFLVWNKAQKLVVTALYSTAYAQASAKSATVSDLVGGNRLEYLGKSGRFYKARFPDGRIGYVPRRDAKREDCWRKELDNTPEGILKTARSMLGFPYLWGGTSPKGMDCSGYVRSVLMMHDIIIPRDAGPQSREGLRIERREDLQPGDLVFFGRWKEDRTAGVSHVGFYLGGGRFIHALGLVKIGSFIPEDALYDSYNTGRYLFGGRILPFIDKDPDLTTTPNNPYYAF